MFARFIVCLAALLLCDVTLSDPVIPPEMEKVIITGRVSGPNRELVPGCHVFAKRTWYDEPWAEGATDGRGRFEVAVPTTPGYAEGHYRVVAFKEGYAVDAVVITADRRGRIRLGADPVSCAGIITNAQGDPLAGATIGIDYIMTPADDVEPHIYLSGLPSFTRVTDQSGRFMMSGLPSGDAYADFSAQMEGMVQVLQEPIGAATDAQDIHIALQPEASISGRITRAGQPLADVGVRARAGGYSPSTTSSPDGNFKLGGLPPETYILSLDPPEGYVAIALTGIELEAGEHYTGAELKLIAGGLIAGIVTDEETGELLAGIRIRTRGPADPSRGSSAREAETDENGRYQLRLAPGKNQVWPSLPNDRYYDRADPRERFVEVHEGVTTTGIDFQLMPRKTINGVVRMPDGQPAANIQMYAAPQNWKASSWPGLMDWTYSTQTDAEGRFDFAYADTFDMMVAESYGLYAFDADASLAAFAVATDTYQSVEMTLAPAAYIISSIIDKNGDPQADVPVHFQVGPVGEDAGTRTHTFATTPSDENGQVRIGSLPSGIPIRLLPDPEIAKWAGELTWEKAGAFTLDTGEQRELPPLRLNLAGRTVRGEVCNEQGEAVSGARIVVCESGDAVQVDAAGRFELGGLPMQETAWIIAIHPTESLYAAVVLCPSHDTVPTLILGPPGGLTGQITDGKGNPIAEQEVSVSAETASTVEALLPQAALRQTVHTDAEGSFSVEGLVAGLWYNIVAFHPYYEPGVWTFARTKPGETVDLGQLSVEPAEPPEPPTIYYGPSDWTPPTPSAPRSP